MKLQGCELDGSDEIDWGVIIKNIGLRLCRALGQQVRRAFICKQFYGSNIVASFYQISISF